MRNFKRYMPFVFLLAMLFSSADVMAKKHEAADTISVKRAFVEMPVNTLDLLKQSTRLDMLDYFAADSVYKAPNTMSGISYLKAVTPDYLSVQLTPVSDLELKVVKSRKAGDIVVSVYTIAGERQASDSDVKFFDSSMTELPRDKFLKLPDLSDFFEIPKGSLTSMKEIRQMVPFPTIEYSLSPDNTEMKAKLTVGAFMDQDDYNIMKLFLKPEITFRWDGTRYKLAK